ncbi:phosphatase PAP2 family protein [Adhaeribacter aquaticus]|uniref:phosphatase PAP2 family protein n=1 Tax=Adhaeribacter aquaticus TaxID=299567 RepID=UPI00041F01E5|nr:phosphatase PAP2 family protein [Adhaeribacter aquaticus]
MDRLIRRTVAIFALFTVELIFILGMFLACVCVFLLLGHQILAGTDLKFDSRAFAWADSLGSDAFTRFMVVITFFASRNFISAVSLILIFYFLFVRRHKWYSLKVPVIALGSISLNLILKYFFNRQRPEIDHLVESSGLSFPSGHAMISASFYSLLLYLIWNRVKNPVWRIVLLIIIGALILLIGFSRIYLHVHYATDVLAGFAAGFIWVILAIFFLNKFERYSGRKLRKTVEQA